MKNAERRGILLLSVFIATQCLLPAGYSQQAGSGQPPSDTATAALKDAKVSPDRVLIKVGNLQVTQADFDFLISTLNPQAQQAIAQSGPRAVADQYATMLVLSQQALAEHLDATDDFHRRAELQRFETLAQAEYENLARQVKPKLEEISQYYSAHQAEFEETQVRQVIVRKKPDGAKEGTPGFSPEEARNRAEAIRKALMGGTDIKQVAKESNIPNIINIDSEPRLIHRGQLIPQLDQVVFQLKDGEVSDIVEIPQAYVFAQVVGHRVQELKEASPKIESTLLRQKLDEKLAEMKKTAGVWMDGDYFKPPTTPGSVPNLQPPAAGRPPQR